MDNIIPVAVGGILAILGGAFAQWVTHRFNAKRERHKLLREKAEAICVEVDRLVRWMGERRNKSFALEHDSDMHPPFGMLVALQSLYFKEASPEVENLGNKATAFLNALSRSYALLLSAKLDMEIEQKMGRDTGGVIAAYHRVSDEQISAISPLGQEFVGASTQVTAKIVSLVVTKTNGGN